MRTIYLYFLLIISLSPALAQGTADSLSLAAERDMLKAESLLKEKRIDSVDYFFNRSTHAFRQLDDLGGWIKAHKKMGRAYRLYLNDYSRAFETLYAAVEEELWRSPQSPAEWKELTWHYVQLAYGLVKVYGNFREGVRYYEKARAIVREQLEVDLHFARFIYQELGNIYTRLGEHEASRVMLEDALEVGLAIEDYPFAGQIYSDLALLYIDKGDFEKAIGLSTAGLKLSGLDHAARGLLHESKARAFFELGRLEEAFTATQLAKPHFIAELSNSWQPKAPMWVSSLLVMQSRILQKESQYPEAKKKLDEALDILFRHLENTGRREVGKLHIQYGELFLAWGKPAEALQSYQDALKSVLLSFHPTHIHALPSPENFYSENTIIEALEGKARTYSILAQKEQAALNLSRAVACHDLVFSAEHALRSSQYYESSKLSVISHSRRRSEEAISTALASYAETKSQKDLEMAFYFAEKSKSILLLEAMGLHRLKGNAGASDTLFNKELQIKTHIARLEESLFIAANQNRQGIVDSLEQLILSQRNEQVRLLKELSMDKPGFTQLKEQLEVPAISQIQRELLTENRDLLEFFVGEKSIYAFCIKAKTGLTVTTIPKDFPLEQWVEDFRNNIERFQYEKNEAATELCQGYTDLALKLFTRLLTPVGKLAEEVVIMPSGVLGYLPFDALLYQKPEKECRYRQYPYWIRQKQLSYAYSAAFLYELNTREKTKAPNKFLGVAPFFDGSGGWSKTEHTIPAVEAVGSMIRGETLTHEQASIQEYKEMAGQYSILHLATHAQANIEKGDFSFVVFAKPTGGYDTLFVRTIYHLPVQAEMVVLGACETAVGRLHQGEGIISLARGFFYAGARSVITTLWQVNDRSAKEISINFYQYLKEGAPKDKALRLARIQQLENSSTDFYAHPVYWASLIPMGDMSSMDLFRPAWLYLAGGGIFLGLILFGFRRRLLGGKALAKKGR